jgi:uncharacterized paraquat-inducible protein A
MIVRCRECNSQMSDQAAACPRCGCPLKATQTIEQTGKEFKFFMLLGGLAFMLGLPIVWVHPQTGIIVAFVGAVTYFAARTMAWWYHG